MVRKYTSMSFSSLSCARYPSRRSSETAYRPSLPNSGQVQTVTFCPFVPDAAISCCAFPTSGALHSPVGCGSTVYGQ